MKKKKYRVIDFDSIDVCLDQMAKDGYRPIRRMEKPVFEEKKNGERVPISQEIIFEAIEKYRGSKVDNSLLNLSFVGNF